MKTQFLKIRILFICFLLTTGVAQLLAVVKLQTVDLTFENGVATDEANCWSFNNVNYTLTSPITLKMSGVTKNVQNQGKEKWIKSPWCKLESRNITFNLKLSSTLGKKNPARSVTLYYIPYDEKSHGEGVPVSLKTFSLTDNYIMSQQMSVSVLSNMAGTGKIQFVFDGKNQGPEILIDDVSIPGSYYSDYSNNCLPLKPILDADKDGVPDAQDQYPNDLYRAYNNYFATLAGYGSLAFEDSWPKKGDYDMNDVVVDYNINRVTNAANEVVEVIAKFVMKASGASLQNGFGFQLDGIAPNKIASVTGYRKSANTYINYMPNGLEQGQDYATCIVFDNFFNEMKKPGVGVGVNTDVNAPFVPYDTISVNISLLNNGQAPTGGKLKLSELSADLFNFFIIANKKRGVEIHLPDRVPTKLADRSLFNTGDDVSVGSHYYRTANNLPWALNIIQPFEYPVEEVVVNEGYLHFIDWAKSSGVDYPDWYDSKEGYRRPEKIYKKK